MGLLLALPHLLLLEILGKGIQSSYTNSMSDLGVLGFLLEHPKGE